MSYKTTIVIDVDLDDADSLDCLANWAYTETYRSIVPDRDVDTAYAIKQAVLRISHEIQLKLREAD